VSAGTEVLTVPIYKNPSRKEWRELVQNKDVPLRFTGDGTVRGIMDKKGDIWTWSAANALHFQVWTKLQMRAEEIVTFSVAYGEIEFLRHPVKWQKKDVATLWSTKAQKKFPWIDKISRQYEYEEFDSFMKVRRFDELVPIYKNPTRKEWKELEQNRDVPKMYRGVKAIRGIMDKKGDVWTWNAMNALHDQVKSHLKLGSDNVNFSVEVGVITFYYDPRPGGWNNKDIDKLWLSKVQKKYSWIDDISMDGLIGEAAEPRDYLKYGHHGPDSVLWWATNVSDIKMITLKKASEKLGINTDEVNHDGLVELDGLDILDVFSGRIDIKQKVITGVGMLGREAVLKSITKRIARKPKYRDFRIAVYHGLNPEWLDEGLRYEGEPGAPGEFYEYGHDSPTDYLWWANNVSDIDMMTLAKAGKRTNDVPGEVTHSMLLSKNMLGVTDDVDDIYKGRIDLKKKVITVVTKWQGRDAVSKSIANRIAKNPKFKDFRIALYTVNGDEYWVNENKINERLEPGSYIDYGHTSQKDMIWWAKNTHDINIVNVKKATDDMLVPRGTHLTHWNIFKQNASEMLKHYTGRIDTEKKVITIVKAGNGRDAVARSIGKAITRKKEYRDYRVALYIGGLPVWLDESTIKERLEPGSYIDYGHFHAYDYIWYADSIADIKIGKLEDVAVELGRKKSDWHSVTHGSYTGNRHVKYSGRIDMDKKTISLQIMVQGNERVGKSIAKAIQRDKKFRDFSVAMFGGGWGKAEWMDEARQIKAWTEYGHSSPKDMLWWVGEGGELNIMSAEEISEKIDGEKSNNGWKNVNHLYAIEISDGSDATRLSSYGRVDHKQKIITATTNTDNITGERRAILFAKRVNKKYRDYSILFHGSPDQTRFVNEARRAGEWFDYGHGSPKDMLWWIDDDGSVQIKTTEEIGKAGWQRITHSNISPPGGLTSYGRIDHKKKVITTRNAGGSIITSDKRATVAAKKVQRKFKDYDIILFKVGWGSAEFVNEDFAAMFKPPYDASSPPIIIYKNPTSRELRELLSENGKEMRCLADTKSDDIYLFISKATHADAQKSMRAEGVENVSRLMELYVTFKGTVASKVVISWTAANAVSANPTEKIYKQLWKKVSKNRGLAKLMNAKTEVWDNNTVYKLNEEFVTMIKSKWRPDVVVSIYRNPSPKEIKEAFAESQHKEELRALVDPRSNNIFLFSDQMLHRDGVLALKKESYPGDSMVPIYILFKAGNFRKAVHIRMSSTVAYAGNFDSDVDAWEAISKNKGIRRLMDGDTEVWDAYLNDKIVVEEFTTMIKNPWDKSAEPASIYKNPTTKEVKEVYRESSIKGAVRVLADPKSNDMFLFPDTIIHHDAVVALAKEGVPSRHMVELYITFSAGNYRIADEIKISGSAVNSSVNQRKLWDSIKKNKGLNKFIDKNTLVYDTHYTMNMNEEFTTMFKSPFPGKHAPISIYKNPSWKEVREILASARLNEMRGLLDMKTSSIYMFNDQVIHAHAKGALEDMGIRADPFIPIYLEFMGGKAVPADVLRLSSAGGEAWGYEDDADVWPKFIKNRGLKKLINKDTIIVDGFNDEVKLKEEFAISFKNPFNADQVVSVYKNPTSREIREIRAEEPSGSRSNTLRAFAVPGGKDIYVFNSFVLHHAARMHMRLNDIKNTGKMVEIYLVFSSTNRTTDEVSLSSSTLRNTTGSYELDSPKSIFTPMFAKVWSTIKNNKALKSLMGKSTKVTDFNDNEVVNEEFEAFFSKKNMPFRFGLSPESDFPKDLPIYKNPKSREFRELRKDAAQNGWDGEVGGTGRVAKTLIDMKTLDVYMFPGLPFHEAVANQLWPGKRIEDVAIVGWIAHDKRALVNIQNDKQQTIIEKPFSKNKLKKKVPWVDWSNVDSELFFEEFKDFFSKKYGPNRFSGDPSFPKTLPIYKNPSSREFRELKKEIRTNKWGPESWDRLSGDPTVTIKIVVDLKKFDVYMFPGLLFHGHVSDQMLGKANIQSSGMGWIDNTGTAKFRNYELDTLARGVDDLQKNVSWVDWESAVKTGVMNENFEDFFNPTFMGSGMAKTFPKTLPIYKNPTSREFRELIHDTRSNQWGPEDWDRPKGDKKFEIKIIIDLKKGDVYMFPGIIFHTATQNQVGLGHFDTIHGWISPMRKVMVRDTRDITNIEEVRTKLNKKVPWVDWDKGVGKLWESDVVNEKFEDFFDKKHMGPPISRDLSFPKDLPIYKNPSSREFSEIKRDAKRHQWGGEIASQVSEKAAKIFIDMRTMDVYMFPGLVFHTAAFQQITGRSRGMFDDDAVAGWVSSQAVPRIIPGPGHAEDVEAKIDKLRKKVSWMDWDRMRVD